MQDDTRTTPIRFDADRGSVFGWSVDESGSLAHVGTWNGLPTTSAGLAAH